VTLKPVAPVIIRVVEAPARETTVADILLGAVGFVGVALLAALVVGLLVGGVFILFKKAFPGNPFNGQQSGETSLNLSALTASGPSQVSAQPSDRR
jgi:hypothetical protein